MALVKLVVSADFAGFQANEGIAVDSDRAVQLVGQRLATYANSGDATTYAAQVAGYQAANDKPVSVQAEISPNGTVKFVGTSEAGRAGVRKFGV
jgi:hypothetical protein